MFDPAFVLWQAGRRTALQSESADPATAGKHDQYPGKEPAKTTGQQKLNTLAFGVTHYQLSSDGLIANLERLKVCKEPLQA